jgi:hypothetical protein
MGFLSPFGWNTRPLFALVSGDVASFRTAGAMMLVAASSALGWSAVQLAFQLNGTLEVVSVRTRIQLVVATFGAGVASLLYYAGLVRTPSYNWLNLVGITIFATSIMLLLSLMPDEGKRRWSTLPIAALGGLGLVTTVPAKPTSPLILLILAFATVSFCAGVRVATRWCGLMILAMVAWMVVLILSGVWPSDLGMLFSNSLALLMKAARTPVDQESQSLIGAVQDMLQTPLYVRDSLSSRATVALVLGFTLLVFPSALRKRWLVIRVTGLASIALIALILAQVPVPFLYQPPTFDRFVWPATATACLVLLLGVAIFRSRWPTSSAGPLAIGRDPRRRTATIISFLMVLPLVYGFGSSHGAFGLSASAAGLYLIAALVLSAASTSSELRTPLIALVTVFATYVTVGTILESWASPYRIPPMSAQTVPVEISNGAGWILLDPDLARLVNSLREQSSSQGFIPGSTPVVGTAYIWNSGIPFLLDAQVPDYLMLAILGDPGSQSMADWTLSDRGGAFPYERAWIISTPTIDMSRLATDEAGAIRGALSKKAGRDFPNDYVCVARAASWILWKPVAMHSNPDLHLAEASCPPAKPADSAYNSVVGWQVGEGL